MNCGNCGYTNHENATLCAHCGTPLAFTDYYQATAYARRKRESAKKESPQAQMPSVEAAPPQKNCKASAKPPRKRKPKRKKRSKLMLLLLFALSVFAVGAFAGRLLFYSGTDRYMRTAERFVRSVVMADEEATAQYVHSKMYGSLRPLSYSEVEACTAEALSYEEIAPDEIAKELQRYYGITESVSKVYRVQVQYAVTQNGITSVHSMQVLIANIGGEPYAVKTGNITDQENTATP